MARQLLSYLAVALAGAVGVTVAQGTSAPGPTQPGTAANCNKWYVVKKDNTCSTVESQYGITHSQFLTWNPAVSNDCVTNFWPDYAYCVGVGVSPTTPKGTTTPPSSTTRTTSTVTRVTSPPGPTFTGTPANCNSWHLVKDGDTCAAITKLYGLTSAQFLSWNPAVSSDCATNFWGGYAYCVGVGPAITSTSTTGRTTSSSSSKSASSSKSSVITTTANATYSINHPITSWVISTPVKDNSTWPPTKTQAGQPKYCNDWYLVAELDDCDSIVRRYNTWMGVTDFFAWNPKVGTDCSGLVVNTWVCVGIQPQTALTFDLPGATNFTLPPYVSWTPTPLPPVNTSFTPTPSQGPMPTNCVNFYQAGSGDTCNTILAEHGEITRDQFFAWNPVLKGNCDGLWANNFYCVGAFSGSNLPQPATVATKPSAAVPSDSVANCVAWYKTTTGDTCADIALMFGAFSEVDFRKWNPAVGADCSGIQIGTWYCVAVPGTPTTRTSALPSTLFPTVTALPPTTTTTTAGKQSTSSGGTTSRPSSTTKATTKPGTTTTRPSTTTSAAAVSTPQPIQGTMVAGCRRFYFVQKGDGCWQITHDAGISLDDFYLWNPAAAPDCTAMWSNVYVCVGISGPVATFSGTPPQPTK